MDYYDYIDGIGRFPGFPTTAEEAEDFNHAMARIRNRQASDEARVLDPALLSDERMTDDEWSDRYDRAHACWPACLFVNECEMYREETL